MAERWGLEVSIDEKGKREIGQKKFSLWDGEHNTIINLNKMVKLQDFIDFTNNGKAHYDLDDVFRYYNELDEVVKDRTGGVIFSNTQGASYNTIYDSVYDIGNPIVISNMVFRFDRGTNTPSQYHMKQVMAHEGGHAGERISSQLTQEEMNVLRKASAGRHKFRRSQLDTPEENDIYTKLIFGGMNISHSRAYDNAMELNKVKYASDYSATRNTYNLVHEEDFAEIMSAVAYRNTNDKSNFRITYRDGRTVGYDEFVADHEATFKMCCDFADGKLSLRD